jgi:hypothetical protein
MKETLLKVRLTSIEKMNSIRTNDVLSEITKDDLRDWTMRTLTFTCGSSLVFCYLMFLLSLVRNFNAPFSLLLASTRAHNLS